MRRRCVDRFRELLSFDVFVAVLTIIFAAGCSGYGRPSFTAGTSKSYAGSEACRDCHQAEYEKWVESGHGYKLTAIDAKAPTEDFPSFAAYPNDAVEPPLGLGWDEVSYVIGGYGWKMRWLDEDGFVVTSGRAAQPVQYNFENRSWATYHTEDEAGTKPYDCGSCHTTGWVADEDAADDGDWSDNQGGLRGMRGTFFATGVQCEACHGPGARHAADPSSEAAPVAMDLDMCGRCHSRDSLHRVATRGGFVRHREQYDEWLHSPHSVLERECNACHDPHASVKYDAVAAGDGVTVACGVCHEDIVTRHESGAECVDCHMPKAVKSAIKDNAYVGDIRAHLWTINIAAEGKMEGMFDASGKFLRLDGEGLGRISLDFACYSCHKDEKGEGGDDSQRTLGELSDFASGMHATSD